MYVNKVEKIKCPKFILLIQKRKSNILDTFEKQYNKQFDASEHIYLIIFFLSMLSIHDGKKQHMKVQGQNQEEWKVWIACHCELWAYFFSLLFFHCLLLFVLASNKWVTFTILKM